MGVRCGTHADRSGKDRRLRQLQTVVSHLEKHFGAHSVPLVIMGDTNMRCVVCLLFTLACPSQAVCLVQIATVTSRWSYC